ncbi:MAG: hypothetical protein WD266_05195 [Balneolales bacterium]
MKTVSILVLLASLFGGYSQTSGQTGHPRILVSDGDKEEVLRKIEEQPWAATIHKEMVARLEPYVRRHQDDPEWILSRYQMNREPGKRYTRHISDPAGTQMIGWKGDAPHPTVRVSTHKRSPVAPDGYRYRTPSLEEVKPYDTDSLWHLQSSGPGGEWSRAEPRQIVRGINSRINALATEAAILYWLSGEDKYARFSSDILYQWARGAFYQEAVEGAGRNGLFCIQSLGDRSYENLALAFDFVRGYMEAGRYETEYFQPVFEKMAKTTMLRGFISNNWYAAQTTVLTYSALALDDPDKRDYYISFYTERDTVIGNVGQLGLPTTMDRHFTPDGHWKENAGYHDMPVGDLLKAAVPVEKNGYRVFENHPALFQASYAMLRYSFPNLQIMGYGDIKGWRHQSLRNLEIATRFAAEIDHPELPGLIASLNQLIDAGLYDRSAAGWYGLLTYLPDMPETQVDVFEWDRAFELDFARLYGHRNGADRETGLMHYVQGATYNHNHANGMAMELYGNGSVMGADPGVSATYEDSVFVHYLAVFAAHNTVIAGGASEPSRSFTGSGGSKHMGDISLSAMEPKTGDRGVSPYNSFTETDYLEPSTDTRQQRLLGIIRTSEASGYYVDVFRSGNELSNDYLYHNIGHEVTLMDAGRNPLVMQADSIPYQKGRQSGMNWFEHIRSPAGNHPGAIAAFRVAEDDRDDAFMQMLMPLQSADKVFTALGPRTGTARGDVADLPTPKVIIHRPEAAWNQPFGVIFEPYRGETGNSVLSARAMATGSTLAAMEVENKNGTRQLILQSDRPEIRQQANNAAIQGHYGVISLTEEDALEYMYLGRGEALAWNGYRMESADGGTGAFVEVKDEALTVSGDKAFTLTFPHRVRRVTDDGGNRLQVESGRRESTVHFPAGTNGNFQIVR